MKTARSKTKKVKKMELVFLPSIEVDELYEFTGLLKPFQGLHKLAAGAVKSNPMPFSFKNIGTGRTNVFALQPSQKLRRFFTALRASEFYPLIVERIHAKRKKMAK